MLVSYQKTIAAKRRELGKADRCYLGDWRNSLTVMTVYQQATGNDEECAGEP
jgi:hypothetical protein